MANDYNTNNIQNTVEKLASLMNAFLDLAAKLLEDLDRLNKISSVKSGGAFYSNGGSRGNYSEIQKKISEVLSDIAIYTKDFSTQSETSAASFPAQSNGATKQVFDIRRNIGTYTQELRRLNGVLHSNPSYDFSDKNQEKGLESVFSDMNQELNKII